MAPLPESYRARLKDLTLLVLRNGKHGMWAWLITRNGEETGKHDPVLPFNDNEHGAKLEAVTAAARVLRMPGDPEDILATLNWEIFPKENRATQDYDTIRHHLFETMLSLACTQQVPQFSRFTGPRWGRGPRRGAENPERS